MDGVSECRSNLNTLEVYSTRFCNCDYIYPNTIIRPIGKYKVNHRDFFKLVIENLIDNDCIIKAFIGDNPKRAFARFALMHSSSFPCEYCFAKATTFQLSDEKVEERKKQLYDQRLVIQERINSLNQQQEEQDEFTEEDLDEEKQTLISIFNGINDSLKDLVKKKHKLVWPASSMNGENRTKEKIIDITNLIEEQGEQNLDPLVKKGIVGKSPLLELEYFNFVIVIPCEYLHTMCLGVCKKLIILTFNVGIVRPRNTKRKLSNPAKFSSEMCKVKVFKELSRRARSLDFSVMKGQEFRNIMLFFFPIVVECIEPKQEERKVWLLFAFLMRACTVSTKEFQQIDLDLIRTTSEQLYKLYEKLFSELNCSYNTHVVFSHLLDIRAHGPLTLTSAFGFENFYGEMRQCFTPGTTSPLKQIMQSIMLKRSISLHNCKSPITFTSFDTALECNRYIYTYVNHNYHFYKIVSVGEDDEDFLCVEIEKIPQKFKETPTLKWGLVGVFKAGKESTEPKFIRKNDVKGKLIKVYDLLITCTNDILREK